ncbi:hypothetical protein KEH51_27940 [[Brevibacterium] frigoritolerans]|uniref:Spore germination GerAC-like C-terminal domain-containing protein n=1 Tax=Peribacillus frigoritolerans TaxID=450367 RepID=A0A941FKB1_9BACI|nr:hypothetical protein [Peribacillus frigoritolerans]
MINNSKLVGIMNDEDIAALNWLNGEVKGGIIEAVQHGEPLSVEVINKTRRKIKTELNGDHLTINIEVRYTGRLSEDWYGKENSFEKPI